MTANVAEQLNRSHGPIVAYRSGPGASGNSGVRSERTALTTGVGHQKAAFDRRANLDLESS